MRKPVSTASSSSSPVGDYEYLKRLKSGAAKLVKVDVFPMQVTGEHATWPEKGQRTLQWMGPVEAALAVQEPELRDLIARFANVELPEEERPDPAARADAGQGRVAAPSPAGDLAVGPSVGANSPVDNWNRAA
jgi:hypothetical protein